MTRSRIRWPMLVMLIVATISGVFVVRLRVKRDSRQRRNFSEGFKNDKGGLRDAVSLVEDLCGGKPARAERSAHLSHPMACPGYLRKASSFITSRSGELHPDFNSASARKHSRYLDVSLPNNAGGTRTISDLNSRLSIEIRLHDATRSEARVRRGHVVYEHGHSSGADLVHVVSPMRVEEYLVFQQPPRLPIIRMI